MTDERSPGELWSGCYRGYRLHTNPDGDVWWQVYQGTERLYVEPTPEQLVDKLTNIKRLGGRVRITEGNDVIALVADGDEYDEVYVGTLSLNGELVPQDDPEYSVPIQPEGLSTGDIWPSVYDGAKFSFGSDRVWWTNPRTHNRHPVETGLPENVLSTLQRLKPRGGSFRVTPWNDVITLVEDPPDSDLAREQLDDLPRVIKNIIVMRRERGVEMLPIYVDSVEETPFDIGEPRSLTDRLSASERAELDSWAGSVGETSQIDPDEHRYDGPGGEPADDPESW